MAVIVRPSGLHKELVANILRRTVTNESGCVIWLGAVAREHGMLYGGTYVHRIVFEHFFGPVPKGLDVGHRCDVGTCINPDHLEAITRQKNVQDAFSRGRFNRGNYTQEDLDSLRAGIMPIKDFSEKYKLTRKHVYNIKLGHKVKWR